MNALLFRKDRPGAMRMRTQVGGISTVDNVLESVATYGLLGGIGYALWKHRWGWALASAVGFVGLSYLEIDQAFAEMSASDSTMSYGLVPAVGSVPASTPLPIGTKNRAPGSATTTATINAQVLADFSQYSLVQIPGSATDPITQNSLSQPVVQVQMDGSGIVQSGVTL